MGARKLEIREAGGIEMLLMVIFCSDHLFLKMDVERVISRTCFMKFVNIFLLVFFLCVILL